jgi:hypothetical protein
MKDNFKFLSENQIYTHEVYVRTCNREIKYRVTTDDEDLGSVQFSATCIGEVYATTFSDTVLEMITSNLTNYSGFISVQYMSHRIVG